MSHEHLHPILSLGGGVAGQQAQESSREQGGVLRKLQKQAVKPMIGCLPRVHPLFIPPNKINVYDP
ncbi:hypothetical protein DFAR_1110029 [Desulfarculales bacterium]